MCSLMADLCALSSVLHSLQVKLAVAAQKSNPKVSFELKIDEVTTQNTE